MNYKEAIEVLRKNYPSSNHTMLIEAVELSIKSLQAAELEDFNKNRIAPPYGSITEIVAKIRQLSPVA